MVLKYLIQFYNYIVNYFSFSSNKVILKHKNSEDHEDLSYNYLNTNTNTNTNTENYIYDPYNKYDEDYQLITPNITTAHETIKKNNNKNKNKLRVKISEYKQEYPVYHCGYCLTYINIPTHMYNGMAFCSVACRRKKMEIDINTSVNSII